MLRYNLKQSWRSLTTNKFLTFLILTSFSVGLAACMVLALYIHREYTVDQCYPNHEHIYRLIDTTKNNASMDYEIAEKLKNSFPEVELATPVIYSKRNYFVRSVTDNQSVIIEQVINTSNDFFTVFSVKTIAGNPKSPFINETSMVLTRSLALRLFGTTDVLGQQLDLSGWALGVVSAVVEDLPDNSSLSAELFLNCMGEKAMRLKMACKIRDACYCPMSIYIKFSEKSDPNVSLTSFNTNFPVNKSLTKGVTLQSLTDIYLAKNITESDNKAGNTSMPIYMTIALTILLLSVFNYVNFTLSKQLSTLRQLGVRFVNGADAAQLRLLCLTEVGITVGIAFLMALGITAMMLPVASEILDSPLRMEYLLSPSLMIISVSVLMILLIASAFAPLYIISSFDIESLFGKKGLRLGKQRVKRSLTIAQMMASIVLLVSLFTIYFQLNYMQQFNLGFDKEHLMGLHTSARTANWAALKQQVDQCSFVEISSASYGVPSRITHQSVINAKDDNGEYLDKMWFTCFYVDEFFMRTFNIPLQAGREFRDTDKGKVCYLNEEALRQTGWKTFEGKRYNNMVEGGLDIIGITANFSVESLHKLVQPVCLMYMDMQMEKDHSDNLSIRLRPGNVVDQLKELERIWKKTIPEAPFQYTFYDEAFDAFYRKEQQQAKAISIFSIIALVITCMGLLGQVFQTCLARVKEIGIRKINGAHASEIILLLNRDLLKWMAVAFVVAVPLSYFIMNKWLENFAYKIALSWWIFVLAGLATLSLATITVSWLTWHAANNNPAEAIKSE